MKRVGPFNPATGAPDDALPWQNGNPSIGREGSIPPHEAWTHSFEEIVNVIEQAGLVPDGEDLTQLDQAIRQIIAGAISGIGGGGGGGGGGGELTAPFGYISGLITERTGNLTVQVKPGVARSDDDTASIRLAAPISKSLNGAWSPGSGSGGLDDGVVESSTWYHLHAIRRSSDGVGDWLYSGSATAPSVPDGWAAPRLIWSVYVDAGGAIRPYRQLFGRCTWTTPIRSVPSGAGVGNARALLSVDVAPISGVTAHIVVQAGHLSQNLVVAVVAPHTADLPMSIGTSSTGSSVGFTIGHTPTDPGSVWTNDSSLDVETDTQGRVAVRANINTPTKFSIDTHGFSHPRQRM